MSRLEGKTKAELIELIQLKDQEISKLNEEIRALETCKRYEDITDEIKDVYTKFRVKDFTREEAFDLTNALICQGHIPAPIRRFGYVNYRNV